MIVDNYSTSFELQPDNGIEIRGWYDDNNEDKELIKLSVALETLVRLKDVREGIKKMNSSLDQFKMDSEWELPAHNFPKMIKPPSMLFMTHSTPTLSSKKIVSLHNRIKDILKNTKPKAL